MAKVFMTFGNSTYYDAAKRIIKQAESLSIFDTQIFYKDTDLKNDKSFWNLHSAFIEKNQRGYGYWIWKSYLIKKTMDELKDGDMLLYLDSGCEIDIREKDYLLQCFEKIKEDKMMTGFTLVEKDWTKMDLIIKLDMNYPKYLDKPQITGGILMFLVCEETKNFVSEWYNLCCDYTMINDSASVHKNLPCFKEHRHDQSICSLLAKKHEMLSKMNLRAKCIKTLRNKTGISKLT